VNEDLPRPDTTVPRADRGDSRGWLLVAELLGELVDESGFQGSAVSPFVPRFDGQQAEHPAATEEDEVDKIPVFWARPAEGCLRPLWGRDLDHNVGVGVHKLVHAPRNVRVLHEGDKPFDDIRSVDPGPGREDTV